jgi:eukaryotic-like serine/threonine-protein kinase
MIPYHNRKTGMNMKNQKKLFVVMLGLLIAGLVSGCAGAAGAASSWPGVTADGETGFFAYSSQVFAINTRNGSLQWQYPAEADSKIQFYAAPAVTEDTVFAGTYANTLAAINRSNGVEKWVFSGAQDRFIGAPLAVNGNVYAPNSDRFLYALNSSGDLLWKFETAGPIWTQPLSDGTNLYVASMDHFVYGLNLEYSANTLDLDKNGSRTLVSSPLWKTDLRTAVVADPVLFNGSIYVATIDGHLHSIDAASGRLNWTYTNGEGHRAVWGSLVVTEEAVFFGDEDGNIFAVSPENGQSLWAAPYSAGASVTAGGVLTEEGPLFINEEGRVFIIGIDQNPQPVVSLNTAIFTSPVVADGRVLLAPATKDKLFTAIDLNGNEIWSFIPSK